MRQAQLTTPELLDKLERFYGKQEPCWPLDPYEFVVWWHSGYPASDAAPRRHVSAPRHSHLNVLSLTASERVTLLPPAPLSPPGSWVFGSFRPFSANSWVGA